MHWQRVNPIPPIDAETIWRISMETGTRLELEVAEAADQCKCKIQLDQWMHIKRTLYTNTNIEGRK